MLSSTLQISMPFSRIDLMSSYSLILLNDMLVSPRVSVSWIMDNNSGNACKLFEKLVSCAQVKMF